LVYYILHFNAQVCNVLKNGLVICHKEIRPYSTTPSFYCRERDRQLFGVFRPYFFE